MRSINRTVSRVINTSVPQVTTVPPHQVRQLIRNPIRQFSTGDPNPKKTDWNAILSMITAVVSSANAAFVIGTFW